MKTIRTLFYCIVATCLMGVVTAVTLADSPAVKPNIDWERTAQQANPVIWQTATDEQKAFIIDWYRTQLDTHPIDSDAHRTPRSQALFQVADPTLPAPPDADDTATLADSMFARWAISYDIAINQRAIRAQLDTLITKGVAVDMTATNALLTEIKNAIATQDPGSGGITDVQMQALTEAINGLGTPLQEISETLKPSSD